MTLKCDWDSILSAQLCEGRADWTAGSRGELAGRHDGLKHRDSPSFRVRN